MISDLLGQLRALDVHVILDGERLRLNAPAGALTDDHRQQLQQHKAEIIEFLRMAQRFADQQKQQRAVVPLQPDGSHVPVFAVAGHNGDVFCYRSIVEHLGKEQPFFGLQPPGLEEGSQPLTDITELASYFATQIRAFRPTGPYTIAGFCAGGTTAFELARQLSQSGQKVTHLVLFGAPFSTAYRTIPELIATGSLLARRSLVHARALLTLPADERREYLGARVRALQNPEKSDDPVDPVIVRRTLVEEATVAALRKYEPQRYEGHIDLMLPSHSWARSSNLPLRWERFAASCTRFVGPDDCNGDNMLRPEHAATFAALFERARENYLRRSLP
jgi:thioesterase domain-containing protein